jgi:hypothetical protein
MRTIYLFAASVVGTILAGKLTLDAMLLCSDATFSAMVTAPFAIATNLGIICMVKYAGDLREEKINI